MDWPGKGVKGGRGEGQGDHGQQFSNRFADGAVQRAWTTTRGSAKRHSSPWSRSASVQSASKSLQIHAADHACTTFAKSAYGSTSRTTIQSVRRAGPRAFHPLSLNLRRCQRPTHILFVHAISLLSFHHLTSPFTLHSASVSALSVNTRGFAESLTTRAKQQGRQPEEPAQKPCAFHHRRQREGSDHCGHFADCCRRRW